MQDLPAAILAALASAKVPVSSVDLAAKMGCDVQKVVGAVKSLEVLEGYIETEMVAAKRWTVSQEGEGVRKEGSHEALVWQQVGPDGLPQKDLMAKCGASGKVGFSKAMSNGWIMIDKADGGKVKRKVADIKDAVQENLNLVKEGKADAIEEKVKAELKKRKLLEEVTEKIYMIKKGPNFSTTVEKIPSEITPEMIQSGSWKKTKFKPYNLNALGVPPTSGHLHPLLKVRAEYRQIFLEMGFTEMPTNNYTESSFWNFDALFQPQQHPARDAHDTFFISNPANSEHFPGKYLDKVKNIHSKGGFGSQGYGYDWKEEEARKNLLRTHTTAVSARMLYKLAQQKEFTAQKYFSIDRVFRNETLDATHLAEFHQIEGVIADRGLTLGDLIGVLHQFFHKLGIEQLRFKPAYNPYTEPSMEIFAFHPGLNKWVEIGNSGMFRPEMLLPMGLPEDVNVIAWGLSLERPTMIKYHIDNIRDLVGHKVDLNMVQSNPLCRLETADTTEERRIAALSNRWDKISSRVEVLRRRVEQMVGPMSEEMISGNAKRAVGSGGTGDLVIHCPPSSPPMSLAALLPKIRKEVGEVFTSQHCHSSLTGTNLNAVAKKLFPAGSSVDRLLPCLSPLYENHSAVNAVDSALDTLGSAVGKHQVTKALTSLVDNSPNFLAGTNPSIADLLALSLAVSNKIETPSLKAWRKRLSEAGFSL